MLDTAGCEEKRPRCVCWNLAAAVSQVIPYNQRISLLLYKMREAVTAMGNQQHTLALGYAASTLHDVAALHK